MNLAIIGSRDFSDYDLLKREVLNFIKDEKLDVTAIVGRGGKPGESLVFRFADESKLEKRAFVLDFHVIEHADALILFRVNRSRDETKIVELARKKGFKIKVVDIKE